MNDRELSSRLDKIAGIIMIVQSALAILYGLITLISDAANGRAGLGILECIIIVGFGVLSAWMISSLFYALAQIVDDTVHIRYKLNRLEDAVDRVLEKGSDEADALPRDNAESAIPTDDPNYITCPHCGLTQRRDRKVCYSCGTVFAEE